MADMNVVVMSGRLTRDPVRRATPKGMPVASFRIAQNGWRNGEEVPVFIDVAAFGKTADVVNEYFKKGDPILVRGKIHFDQWTGKDGGTRSKHEILADQISFFARRKREEGGTAGRGGGGESTVGEEEVIPF